MGGNKKVMVLGCIKIHKQIYYRSNKGNEMDDLVFSKKHVDNCIMCYKGCEYCNYGMVTKEQKEKIDKEYKVTLKKVKNEK